MDGSIAKGVLAARMFDVVMAAAVDAENLPLPGDYFNLWLWVALLAVGVIGFAGALFFLLIPTKRGKYERVQPTKKVK